MIGVIIQARTGSSRFPRKIYEDLNGKSNLYRVLHSVTNNKLPNKIILAMPEYDKLEFNEKLSVGEFKGAVDYRFCTYFGDANNLVDRYFNAARMYGINTIVRITADCPFGGVMADEMIIQYMKSGENCFMGNNQSVSRVPYPSGCDIEIFPYWMLAETARIAKDPVYLEHVAPFMYRKRTQYKIRSFLNAKPNSIIAMKFDNFSFDTDEDKQLLIEIIKKYDLLKSKNPDMLEPDLLNKAIKATSFPSREIIY